MESYDKANFQEHIHSVMQGCAVNNSDITLLYT